MRPARQWACILMGGAMWLGGCASMTGGGSGPVAERQALMEAMKEQAGDITDAFNVGAEGFDTEMIARSAQQIAANAHRIPALFPAGSDGPDSRALPAIWTDFAAFTRIANELEQSASSLAQAALAEDDENLMEKSVKVFHYCKTCHAQFRRPVPKS